MRLALLLLISLTAGSCLGWGHDGHRLVCALAERQLTPEATTMVRQLMAMNRHINRDRPEQDGAINFVEGCVWPDSAKYGGFRGSYEQHFINVARDAEDLDLVRDCAAMDCIAVGIQRSLVYLSTPPQGDRESGRAAAALRFLGHYIGDLHQPLHVSHAEDWGGNRIKVTWFGAETNLHRVWDADMPARLGLVYPGALDDLGDMAGTVHSNAELHEWMRDSLRLARAAAYRHPGGDLVGGGDALGQAYLDANRPIVTRQIELAGSRLAHLLNALAAGRLEVRHPFAGSASRVEGEFAVNGKISTSQTAAPTKAIGR